jgi:hypothetical protein
MDARWRGCVACQTVERRAGRELMTKLNETGGARVMAVLVVLLLAMRPAWGGVLSEQARRARFEVLVLDGVAEPSVQILFASDGPARGARVVFTIADEGAGGWFANGSRSFSTFTDSQGVAVARGVMSSGIRGISRIEVTVWYEGVPDPPAWIDWSNAGWPAAVADRGAGARVPPRSPGVPVAPGDGTAPAGSASRGRRGSGDLVLVLGLVVIAYAVYYKYEQDRRKVPALGSGGPGGFVVGVAIPFRR